MSVDRLEILQAYCLIDVFLQVADEPSLRNNCQPDLKAKASLETYLYMQMDYLDYCLDYLNYILSNPDYLLDF